jgi:predicted nucleic acid-binding protein
VELNACYKVFFQCLIIFVLTENKMKQKIYIDTSVVGGYFDEEFKEATIKLFERLENNEIIFVVSDLLDLELINAPQHVREHLFKYPANKFERIELTVEAIQLADKYITENVVGKTSLEDCRHIAMATIHKVDVLASWNFKHIVNLDRIKGYNSVNLRLGYSMIEIRSPKDLVNYESE